MAVAILIVLSAFSSTIWKSFMKLCIWDLNKCGVKIWQTMAKCKVVTHRKAQNGSMFEIRQLMSVLKRHIGNWRGCETLIHLSGEFISWKLGFLMKISRGSWSLFFSLLRPKLFSFILPSF